MKYDTIIFIGPQGSGKGTQAKILSDRISAEYIEMGALLRNIAKEDSELGRRIREIVNGGTLVPDKELIDIFHSIIQKISPDKVVIFDGVPRMVAQAEYIIKYLASVGRTKIATVHLQIPRDESVKRLLSRRICENCRHPAILDGTPNQVCKFCGGKLVKRDDDNEEAINTRLGLYQKETYPVIHYLRGVSDVSDIDGTPSISEVAKSISRALELPDV